MSIDDLLARHAPAVRLSDDRRDGVLTGILGTADDGATPGRTRMVAVGSDEHDEVLLSAVLRPARRRGVLAAVAAAVLVLAVAGVFAVRGSGNGNGNGNGQAGADEVVAARPVCPASLPATWTQAYATIPLSMDGSPAAPIATDAAGDVLLQWFPSKGRVAFAVQRADGPLVRVGTFPGSAVTAVPPVGQPVPSQWSALATDGRYVVLSRSTLTTTGTKNRRSVGTVTSDLVLVDLRTGHRTHLLPGSPTPTGYILASEVALWDGVVYWGSAPRDDDHHGVVLAYDIAAGQHRVVADVRQPPEIVSDVRGVSWPGGSVTAPDLPSVLNPQLDGRGHAVDRLVTDGDHYAWQTVAGDQTVVHWADRSGDTRVFRVTRLDHGSDFGGPSAVAGPFVFLHVNTGGSGNSVLDVRTGAVAPLPAGDSESAPGHRLYVMDGAFRYRTIDAARLPALHC